VETENRLATAGLNQQLRSVRSFSFFQLGNLLQRFAHLHNQVEDVPIHVRYRAMPSLAFPAADVDHCEIHAAGYRQFLDVTVTFMGLFGPASPLPAFYTERVIQAQDQKSPSRDLMDIFNHRSISLLQRCWEKYRYYTRFQPDGSDQYTRWLLSLLGVDAATLECTTPLRWHKLLPFSGVMANNVCSGDLLARMVKQYFRLDSVRVQPWVYRDVRISPDQCNRMGVMNCALAEDLVLGESLGDFSGKFALCLAGLEPDQYERLLPGGADYAELVALVRFILKDPLSFDLHLECVHNGDGPGALGDAAGRLGWNYRLGETDGAPLPATTVICVEDFPNV
jgi:type VI secretion system protein ImpH